MKLATKIVLALMIVLGLSGCATYFEHIKFQLLDFEVITKGKLQNSDMRLKRKDRFK